MTKTARMNMPAMLRLMELADYVIPLTLHTVVSLGIADRLADGPVSAARLAADTDLDPNALERTLRALTCKDLLVEEPAGTFALAPLGRYLCSTHPDSVGWATAWDTTEVALWAAAADDLHASEWAFVDAVCPRAATLPAHPDAAADVQRVAELADAALPTTIRAVSQLGVADLLADGPLPLPALAEATGTPAGSLSRALRALTDAGIFTEVEPGVFGNADMADLMRAGREHSLQGCLPLMAADLRAWAWFEYTLRTGKPAFEHVHDQSYYEYLAERPDASARFDSSQVGATRLELRAALRGYEWGALGTLVDVGGGNGTFLAGILERHPTLRGVLFDLPFVVAPAAKVLADHGVTERCDVVGGTFFDEGAVPAGHDAYLLKRTLYNWDSDSAVRILTAIREAMTDDSRLLVFEPTRRPGDTFDVAKLTDVIMLVFTGGALRTIEEISDLAAKAGLRLSRVVPTPMFPVLEFVPAGPGVEA